MESILTSIKKLLGPTEDDVHYDVDIMIHINTALMTLNQIGVGKSGFTVKDASAVWTDFEPDIEKMEAVKTYVYLSVRMVFDPPTIGGVIDSYKQTMNELVWRLNVAAESKEEIQNG